VRIPRIIKRGDIDFVDDESFGVFPKNPACAAITEPATLAC
jgi:hypothetical protein